MRRSISLSHVFTKCVLQKNSAKPQNKEAVVYTIRVSCDLCTFVLLCGTFFVAPSRTRESKFQKKVEEKPQFRQDARLNGTPKKHIHFANRRCESSGDKLIIDTARQVQRQHQAWGFTVEVMSEWPYQSEDQAELDP
eukprot:1572080-Amphidinium_carterae.2